MRLPKLLQNSAIYTLIQILQKGVLFFLLPIYTAYLSPADYGVLGVTTSISSFVAIFIALSLSSAASRFYYKEGRDELFCRRVFGTIAAIIVINSVVVGVLLILFHKFLLDPITGEISFYPYLLLSILYTIVTPLYTLYQDYLRTRQNGLHFGINSLSNFVLNVTLIVVSLSVFHLGVVGVLLANLITAVVFFLYVAFAFLKKLNFRIERPLLKQCFSYSLPLLPHTLANWSNGMIDRLLVNGLRSKTDAGLYNLGQQYGSILNNVAIGVNSAFTPWFYDKVNDGEHSRPLIAKVSEMVVAAVSLLAVVMTLFSKEILDIMTSNPAYNEVWRIIPFISGAYIFQCVYFFFIQTLFLNDTKVVFTVTLVTVVINVVLNILLIPKWGYYGCAMACVATYFMKSVMAVIVSKIKKCNKYFKWQVLYGIALLGLCFCLLSWIEIPLPLFGVLLIKTVVVSVISLLVYLHYKKTIKVFMSTIKKK